MIEALQRRVAIVGGTGRVGAALRRELANRVQSILVLDLVEPDILAANEEFRRTDIQNVDDLRQAFQSVDALVHLAGIPKEAPLADILRVNVEGTTNVYEAARLADVPRVVLGSSNHVVGYYPRDTVVGPADQMRPDGLYGLSKCWAELVAGLYYDKFGIRTLIVRIGNASQRPHTPRSLEVWVSPRDLCQLVVLGLSHPDVTVTTVYGVSKGGGSWWDNSAATRLGYVPQDEISECAAPGAFTPEEEDAVSRHFQGGRFAAAGHDGAVRQR